MSRHPNDRTGQIAALLSDPSYKAEAGPIPGSTPSWTFDRRGRTIYHTHMKEHESMSGGFAGFLASDVRESGKLVDSAKRHFVVPESTEVSWRSSVHAVPEVQRDPHASGKKPAPHSFPKDGEEYHDIPRGRRHCEAPDDLLPHEMALFEKRIGIVRDKSGYAVRDTYCPPTETSSFSGLNQRMHLTEGGRNRVPCAVLGDKPYSAVELSSEFRFSEKHRLGLEPIGKVCKVASTFEVKERAARLQRDIHEVQTLPKYPKDTTHVERKATPVEATRGKK